MFKMGPYLHLLATTLTLLVLVQSGCFYEAGKWLTETDAADADADTGPVSSDATVAEPADELTVTIVTGPPPRTTERQAYFEFACNREEGCSFACNLDGTGVRRCPFPAVFDDLAVGAHRLDVFAYDELGNSSEVKTWRWTVESPPVDPDELEILITQAPPETSHDDGVWFAFECVGRRDCAFECALVRFMERFDLETGPWEPCASPTWVELHEPGEYILYIRATSSTGLRAVVRHFWAYTGPYQPTSPGTWPAVWTSVVTGNNHSCGIGEDGSLWCWGGNNQGELGIGPWEFSERDYRAYPSEVDGGSRWLAISAGLQHSCGIRDDGSMWCWGTGFLGQLGAGTTSSSPSPVQVGTQTNWAFISSGGQHNCGIREDGTLWCWGNGSFGRLGLGDNTSSRLEPVQVGDATDWRQISAGGHHTCGVRDDGTLWCWGRGIERQLGIGTTMQRNTPTRVGSGSNWAWVATGAWHTCAVRIDGSLWCWGQGAEGRLGLGDVTDREVPVRVGEMNTWARVTAGFAHSCGLMADGTLWCWGRGGQLGLDDLAFRTEPEQVGEEEDWQMVAAGGAHGCGLREAGTLWCWGGTAFGQLGIQDRVGDQYRPVPVAHPQSMRKVSAYLEHSCGIATDGSLWCWGANWTGQLGVPGLSLSTVPAQVGSDTDWRDVTVGSEHTCGVRDDGSLWCWGRGRSRVLGLGDDLDREEPTRVGTDTNWERVAAGSDHTCALRSDGTLWCWGSGESGRLGLGDTQPRDVPTRVGIRSNWTDVSAGLSHTCGLLSDGSLWCWGRGNRGALGLGDTVERTVPTLVSEANRFAKVAVGLLHTCAVDVDSTLWCWGFGSVGQLGVGDTYDRNVPTRAGTRDTHWSTIATGGSLTCGLMDDGSLWCWGGGNRGAHGNNTMFIQALPLQVGNASDWVGVAAGRLYGLAIRANGDLWAWGANDSGQLGDGTARVTRPTQVRPP
jgi:alpha-tubulin suppressor-like RCC1 family protein